MRNNITEYFTLEKTASEFLTFSGLDSSDKCVSPEHFYNYPKLVVYQYNQLGFRDDEWPVDLKDQIWCVGDSFTKGLGQPFDEIWPRVLQHTLGQRTINVSMDGASNDWIARKVRFILDNLKPRAVLVQWSYIHRREHHDALKCDEDRIMHHGSEDSDDFANFKKNLITVNDSRLVHSFIPKFCNLFSENKIDEKIYSLMQETKTRYFVPPLQVDYARDGHHYDILTVTEYVNQYIKQLK